MEWFGKRKRNTAEAGKDEKKKRNREAKGGDAMSVEQGREKDGKKREREVEQG